MKKIILVLLLIFSFSYGEENLYITKNSNTINLTQKYAFELYAIHPTKAKLILNDVLVSYENVYGSESLIEVSTCFGFVKLRLLKYIEDCEVLTHIMAFNNFVKEDPEYSLTIVTQVVTSFGIVMCKMAAEEIQKGYNNGKKKRI